VSQLVHIPVEVAAEAAVFDVVARGYHRRQVDAHVSGLEQELAELRWEHDDLAAQRRALVDRRAEQERWTPSFSALGERAAEILRLAEQEAAALRGDAAREVRAQEHRATAELAAAREQQAHTLEQARRTAERELRMLASATQARRELLEVELGRTRRDADLEIAGRLAQAAAQAQDIRAQALREADQVRAAVHAEVAQLQRRRDQLAGQLTDLSERLVAVVHRLDRTDTPLEIQTG